MKIVRASITTVLAGVALILVGCGTTAHVEKDETADFSNYKTYSWIDKTNKDKKSNDLTETQILQAVNKEIQKTGWRESKNRPDVLLDYDILVERNTRTLRDPVYSQPYSRVFYNPYTRRYGTIHYPSQFMGYDSYEKTVKEGTITITMIDARSDKTIWQGWATEEINNRNLTGKEIQNSVKSIFRKFDVAKN
jgi:Domain of unknown function (DUF4136)